MQKKREFKQLTLDDRINIQIKYRDGWSFEKIANYLGDGRNKGTISREIDGKPARGMGKYQAYIAHEKALKKRKGKKTERLKNQFIRDYVKEKLALGWSPEQISIRLNIDHPREEGISYEAIYQYIYAQININGQPRANCEDLRMYLPRRHKKRQKKNFRQVRKMYKPKLPSIEDRPKEVDRRKVIGHWEDDCIVSRQSKSRLKTVNERVTGLFLIGKMKNGSIEESNKAVVDKWKVIPSEFKKTLTRDNGVENFGWEDLETRESVKVYFAHPYCSYERGSNENGNGLIRRYLPKGTDFSKVSNEDVLKIEYLLNSRPRKRLKGKTPLEVWYNMTGVAITY
jgi:IS30 family transposase